ncbi:MAG: Lactonase, 7-bladed beta-propeller, partial [Solirubrobacteraceae bacterium]|nr:Lactonase, 7-bladed beta-propeller [Solirubrobacteraceae bacterium]
PRGCILYTGHRRARGTCRPAPKARGAGFFGARSIAIAPDGRTALAGFDRSSAILLLRRDPASGALTPIAGPGGCVKDAGRHVRVPRGCADGRGIFQPDDIAISADGRNAYVTTVGGLSIFALS